MCAIACANIKRKWAIMGQAKQRGTYEQRVAAAQDREAAARMERKRVAAEREAEYRRLDEEARERRRERAIALGVDPDLPKQSDYSAFGRRRVVSIGATRMAGMAALALVAHARSVPTLREVAQMQR